MNKVAFLGSLAGVFLGSNVASAEQVEIYLVDMLDNVQNGYCLDIARAQGVRANPDDGLQGHTCYSPSGKLGVDQAFDAAKFMDGVLYMPEFDVCVDIPSTQAGAGIELAACNDSLTQGVSFVGEGTISPSAAPEMCLTVGDETRTGRSKANQIKVLTLEPCDENRAAYQIWSVRTSAE